MKNSLRVHNNQIDKRYLSIEIRIIHNNDAITTELEDQILQVIVTSVSSVLTKLSKNSQHIKEDTRFFRLNPIFYSEVRKAIEVFF